MCVGYLSSIGISGAQQTTIAGEWVPTLKMSSRGRRKFVCVCMCVCQCLCRIDHTGTFDDTSILFWTTLSLNL